MKNTHLIHVTKITFMQRVLDNVANGYVYCVTGHIPIEKAPALFDKFEDRYGVYDNRNQRAYRKKQGRSNTRLLVYYQTGKRELFWMLLSTQGEGRFWEEEKPKTATDKRSRIVVTGDYELVQLTIPKKQGGGQRWSWRMTDRTYTHWNERITQAARSKSRRIHQSVRDDLIRAPGFRGIRQQTGTLMARFKRQYRRHHGTLDGFPMILKLGYVQRCKDELVDLQDILDG